jgi:hypothetical protein
MATARQSAPTTASKPQLPPRSLRPCLLPCSIRACKYCRRVVRKDGQTYTCMCECHSESKGANPDAF